MRFSSQTSLLLLLVFLLLPSQSAAQGSSELLERLERLQSTGRVLMIAAHPDDENTAFLAYCARGRKFQTAYLSLTRGEGGQNLIGSEQGALLGIIRTEELLAARRIDGAQQFFTRAIDFGFSKTAEETIRFWGHDQVLADVVWVIRSFRPDVIVFRFSGTPRDGHGHHQASAMLGKQAFSAAADPTRFPEQLQHVKPWQAKRAMWNGFSFNREQEREMAARPRGVAVELGQYDPLLGLSYGELASFSRSQHRSQGFGSAPRRGSQVNLLFTVEGDEAHTDFMDGVDTSWRRIPGGEAVAASLDLALAAFDPRQPSKTLPALIKARQAMAALKAPEALERLSEIDEAIALAAGLFFDASTNRAQSAPAAPIEVTFTAVARGPVPVRLSGASAGSVQIDAADLKPNTVWTQRKPVNTPTASTQPFWLARPAAEGLYDIPDPKIIAEPANPPALTARGRFLIEGAEIELSRPVDHVWVDRSKGELRAPLEIVPPVSVELEGGALVFTSARPKQVSVDVAATRPGRLAGSLSLSLPSGWSALPASAPFETDAMGRASVAFTLTPPPTPSSGRITAVATVANARYSSTLTAINYPHITSRRVAVPAQASVIRNDIKTAATRIGYVMGAGDEVPQALSQLGCTVTLLEKADLEKGDLSRFDAVVTGVRAFNVRADLRAAASRLWSFAEAGGTVVVQYNVMDGQFFSSDPGTLNSIGPFPIQISRDRVTVEDSPVTTLLPAHPLLNFPNRIEPSDWSGWIQERGLYFASTWDEHYQSPLELTDPGEKPSRGALLTTRVGKGAYVMTSLSFFRQLPAGVPGAYRLFANLISAAKAPPAGTQGNQ